MIKLIIKSVFLAVIFFIFFPVFAYDISSSIKINLSNPISSPTCIPPVFNGAIEEYETGDGDVDLPVAPYFSGSDLTFSAPNLIEEPGLKIDSSTGLISGVLQTGPALQVIVIASNSCGIAQSDAFLMFYNES